jgi:MATE family multidrug resistance protein
MGYFGANALAAHQIALQCATFAFMFPLGIAQATAIRVGQNLGTGSPQKAKYAGYIGLLLGASIALMTAIIFISIPTAIISLFIDVNNHNQHTLIPMAVSFISVMALFQLVDATQVIMNGALRGLKDTYVPMWLGLLSYWISGLLSGYYLAFTLKWGGVGLWWGLGIGIGVSALLLILRFNYRIRQEENLYKQLLN